MTRSEGKRLLPWIALGAVLVGLLLRFLLAAFDDGRGTPEGQVKEDQRPAASGGVRAESQGRTAQPDAGASNACDGEPAAAASDPRTAGGAAGPTGVAAEEQADAPQQAGLTIAGRVVDDAGRPIERVSVWACLSDQAAPPGRTFAQGDARTAADGSYELRTRDGAHLRLRPVRVR
ncbi:MAG: hypothetical protein HY905_11890 [Deltaproteobacteria bacterium]|nr:hypothetical protein [Deltaproteobacteria bacterium]